ncbi:MAG: hypothetical protein ACRENL_04215 [Candidatus Dormibacteria bacterium]
MLDPNVLISAVLSGTGSPAKAHGPRGPATVTSADPDDDCLIALAQAAHAVIVSGDAHLLDLADRAPVHSPAGFLTLLSSQL